MNIAFASDMRTIDERVVGEYGLPALALMENAGRRTAEETVSLIGSARGKSVCVFAQQRRRCLCCRTASDEYGRAREAVFYRK